ncbi:HTH CENPB-type domain-containing protein [Trichonephila clavipes]|nr:HTH CENPB-type domain-containing protein [Trichonephila clavipes]
MEPEKSAKKGGSRLKRMDQLKIWEEQIRRGGSTKDKYTTIDKWTHDRFVEARQSNQQVTTRNLQQWALAAASQFPNLEFKASEAWVKIFKRKHRIRQRKITKFVLERETATMEETHAAAEKFRLHTRALIPNYDKDFDLNTDQTGGANTNRRTTEPSQSKDRSQRNVEHERQTGVQKEQCTDNMLFVIRDLMRLTKKIAKDNSCPMATMVQQVYDSCSSLEFVTWKEEEENKTMSKYVRQQGCKTLQNGEIVMNYHCCRSGTYKPKGKGLRNLKSHSSAKIGISRPPVIKRASAVFPIPDLNVEVCGRVIYGSAWILRLAARMANATGPSCLGNPHPIPSSIRASDFCSPYQGYIDKADSTFPLPYTGNDKNLDMANLPTDMELELASTQRTLSRTPSPQPQLTPCEQLKFNKAQLAKMEAFHKCKQACDIEETTAVAVSDIDSYDPCTIPGCSHHEITPPNSPIKFTQTTPKINSLTANPCKRKDNSNFEYPPQRKTARKVILDFHDNEEINLSPSKFELPKATNSKNLENPGSPAIEMNSTPHGTENENIEANNSTN